MKLYKIPPRIRITRRTTYEVVYTDEFKDKNQMGECNPESKQITLKNGMSNTNIITTFIHEVIHSLSLENDFPLTEKQVESLERSIYRMLRLNKWL